MSQLRMIIAMVANVFVISMDCGLQRMEFFSSSWIMVEAFFLEPPMHPPPLLALQQNKSYFYFVSISYGGKLFTLLDAIPSPNVIVFWFLWT